MKKTLIRISVTLAVLLALAVSPTIANDNNQAEIVVSAPANLETPNVMVETIVAKEDDRSTKLGAYFASKNSPFQGSAKDFIAIADRYNIEWTLLPAIAGLESSFGLHVPAYSFNPYGWNNGKYRFESWAHATEVVAQALRTRYVPAGEVTPNRIGRMYAESPTWAIRVARFQQEINRFAAQ